MPRNHTSFDTDPVEALVEAFRESFLDRDWYWNPELVEDFIRSHVAQFIQAFGGCTHCYGKGYGTIISFTEWYEDFGGEGFRVKNSPYVPCPKCERGTQFAEVSAQLIKVGQERATAYVKTNANRIDRDFLRVSDELLEEAANLSR